MTIHIPEIDHTQLFLHIYAATLFAFMLGWSYKRAWGFEHGNDFSSQDRLYGADTRDMNTAVWVSPLCLPIIFLLDPVLLLISAPNARGLSLFFEETVNFTLTTTILYALLLALMPLLRRHFSARACATAWLLPSMLCGIMAVFSPISYYSEPSLFTLDVPEVLTAALLLLWAIGFIAIFGRFLYRHLRLRRQLSRTATPECSEDVLTIWKEEQEALHLKTPILLMRCADIRSPFSIGHTKKTRMCVLPMRAYTEHELRLIFRHELHHLRRRDTDSKLFFAFIAAFCWYNPLVWIAFRQAADDLELSCDEVVLADADETERNCYANLILNTAAEAKGFTTCLSARASSLRYRLRGIMQTRKTSAGTLMLMTLTFLFIMCYGYIAVRII